MNILNECGQLWASRAAQALDARLTNHVVDPSVNPALGNHVYIFTFKKTTQKLKNVTQRHQYRQHASATRIRPNTTPNGDVSQPNLT